MERVPNTILLHGVACMGRWIALPDNKKEHPYDSNKEHAVKKKVKHTMFHVNNNLF